MNATVGTPRKDTPQRWEKAAARAAAEGIEIRQCAGSGLWIATSGSDSSAAYELDVQGMIATGCACLAGMNDDPVCKHRAAYYLMVGALAIDPEPPTPADPAAPAVRILPQRVRGLDACWGCSGFGYIRDSFATPCTRCGGTGRDPELAAA